MAFTGKATYSAGSTLPEIMEDVSDIIGIVSPHETPLLDHLGDPRREAKSTVHEWLEDTLHPNFSFINQTVFTPDALTATSITVDHGSRFRIGDQVQIEGSREVMMVTIVAGSSLLVTRGYGGTTAEALADNQKLIILGNAALEGADTPTPRFTNRIRKSNYTQIFSAGVEVSGSQLAVSSIGIADELEYQKQERLRELLRDLENCVLNGTAATTDPQGTDTVRRTMQGILPAIVTNGFEPGTGPIPDGDGAGLDELNEAVLNAAMRAIWEQSSAQIDTIVVNGFQKRKINSFASQLRGYESQQTNFRDLISVYESDFGVCRIVLSRWMPPDAVLFLDSSRISVLPLAARSFGFKATSATGDREAGIVLGEYTVEMMNENAHGVLRNLAIS